MTSHFDDDKIEAKERADYGFARARDIAFDAVRLLWSKRQKDGMKQTDLAQAIGKEPAWVSRNLKGPGNWTLKTLGAFVEALDGELVIQVRPSEEPVDYFRNYSAYDGYRAPVGRESKLTSSTINMTLV